MRTESAREEVYREFDQKTRGRMQSDVLTLLWRQPMISVTSLEAQPLDLL
jgi:hypothetical protein